MASYTELVKRKKGRNGHFICYILTFFWPIKSCYLIIFYQQHRLYGIKWKHRKRITKYREERGYGQFQGTILASAWKMRKTLKCSLLTKCKEYRKSVNRFNAMHNYLPVRQDITVLVNMLWTLYKHSLHLRLVIFLLDNINNNIYYVRRV